MGPGIPNTIAVEQQVWTCRTDATALATHKHTHTSPQGQAENTESGRRKGEGRNETTISPQHKKVLDQSIDRAPRSINQLTMGVHGPLAPRALRSAMDRT